ncbi:MAG: hypothetical protein D6726_07400, partial [Nitrospirae bacterium]
LYPAQAITVQDYIKQGYREKKDICTVVKNALKEQYDCKDVVQVSIQEGHTACLVVRCAIEGNGPLEAIIKGALQAGATSDVISRCAIDAGAEPREVAGILEREGQPGLGYTPPPGAGPAPITAGPPGGGGTGGGLLSPASF